MLEEHVSPPAPAALVIGVQALLQFPGHMGAVSVQKRCEGGSEESSSVSSIFMLAEVLSEPMGFLSQPNGWAEAAIGIV